MIPRKSLVEIEVVVVVAPAVLVIPVKAPELAKAYLTNPKAAVPRRLLFREIVDVIAPVFVIPVTATAVLETAMPRIVLFEMLNVAPVEAFLIPTTGPDELVVEVSIPALDNGPPATPVVVV